MSFNRIDTCIAWICCPNYASNMMTIWWLWWLLGEGDGLVRGLMKRRRCDTACRKRVWVRRGEMRSMGICWVLAMNVKCMITYSKGQAYTAYIYENKNHHNNTRQQNCLQTGYLHKTNRAHILWFVFLFSENAKRNICLTEECIKTGKL